MNKNIILSSIFLLLGSLIWSMEETSVKGSAFKKRKLSEIIAINVVNALEKDVTIRIRYGITRGYIKVADFQKEFFFFPKARGFKFRLNEIDFPFEVRIWPDYFNLKDDVNELSRALETSQTNLKNSLASCIVDKEKLKNGQEIYIVIEEQKNKIQINLTDYNYFNTKLKDKEIKMGTPVLYEEKSNTSSMKIEDNSSEEELEDSTVKCNICFKKLGDNCIKLSCGHNEFHSSCIEQWSKIKPTCPICRKDLIILDPNDKKKVGLDQ